MSSRRRSLEPYFKKASTSFSTAVLTNSVFGGGSGTGKEDVWTNSGTTIICPHIPTYALTEVQPKHYSVVNGLCQFSSMDENMHSLEG